YEYNAEQNNWTGRALSSTLTPPPDLVVTSVTPPADAESGQEVELQWTVENQGPGPTRVDTWRDVVYLSPTATFDSSTAVVLGSFRHVGVLVPDASYTGSGFVRVPDGVEGEQYFFVATDGRSQVYEHTFEANNRGAAGQAAAVTLAPYPDLQVTQVSAGPPQVQAGRELALSYTVENTGTATVSSGWVDSVYVLTSPVWDPGAAPAAIGVDQDPGLQPGDSRERTVAVRVPAGMAGTAYVFVKVDARGLVFEHPDLEKNEGRSGAISVGGYPPVDLEVSVESVPATALSGDILTVAVRVTNVGAAPTLVSEWADRVYLSTDESIDSDDVLIADRVHQGRLAAGDGYVIGAMPLPEDVIGN